MKASMKWICLTALSAGLFAGVTPAQDRPAERERDVPQDVRPRGERGGPREGGLGPREGGGPGMREGRPEGMGPRPIRPIAGAPVDAMRNYLDMVEQYARVTRDPASTGVAAVLATTDVLRSRGPEEAIAYFTKLLPKVKNETVIRAIRLQLVDLYKASGQQDKALGLLEQMMTEAPGGGAPAATDRR